MSKTSGDKPTHMDSNPDQEGINAAHKMMRISRIHLLNF